MKLKQSSFLFAVGMVLAMTCNAVFLLKIKQSYDSMIRVQEDRQRTMTLANDLQLETDQMANLVRAYTSTGNARYLTYYKDILAIREGRKPLPDHYMPFAYWDLVIAGELPHAFPKNAVSISLSERMRSLGFTGDEFRALDKVYVAAQEMQRIEQIAFTATQGAYEPTRKVPANGKPTLDFANHLVYSSRYNFLKAQLARSVRDLQAMVDQRTKAAETVASAALRFWIYLTLASMLLTYLMVLASLRVVRVLVLKPIEVLSKGAGQLAQGDYATRTGFGAGPRSGLGGVEELMTLGLTLDGMASSIEQDIQFRERTRLQLEEAQHRAEEATRAKSMFLANMSHEIRTPMNAIIGMSHLALKTDLTPKQKDYVGKVHQAARSLLGIINDILDFSKVEAGKLHLEQVRFHLGEVIGNSLTLVRQTAQDKGLELLLDVCDPALLGRAEALMGDPMRLGQILTNLLSNAVKFTSHGFITLTVRLAALSEETATLHLSLQDSGIGMTPEQVGNLFQEFTQADGSTTRKYGGTGLGLTISKRLVELMGGRIWVESVAGVGTTFHVEAPFPLASGDSPYALAGQESLRVLVAAAPAETRAALGGLVRAMGIGHGHPAGIGSAADGEQTLHELHAAEREGAPWQVVLIDWDRPELDGAGLLKGMRQAGLAQPPLPVVVCAQETESLRASVLHAWPTAAFLTKPVLPDALCALIREITGDETGANAADSAATVAAGLEGMRVLLVEDNPINQQLAVELMEAQGVQVAVANHGQEALDQLAAKAPDHFDAVLMDLQMPVMDGYEATARLRKDPRYASLPIVAMTAHAMAEERERCEELGMTDHVSKPIEPDLLYTSLERCYTNRRAPEPVAPAAPDAPAPLAGPLPTIPGLDTAAGLRRAGHKEELYLWLLKRFVTDNADTAAQIETAMATDQWEEAQRLAHTVKGLLGSMGAAEVQGHAEQLEDALKRRSETWRALLPPFTEAMAPLLAGLREHFPAEAPMAEEAAEAAEAALDGAALPSWLNDFTALCAEGDFKANELWEGGKGGLAGLVPAASLRRVSAALDDFDYEGARAVALEVLGAHQGPGLEGA